AHPRHEGVEVGGFRAVQAHPDAGELTAVDVEIDRRRPVRVTPQIANGKVYFGSDDATGAAVWTFRAARNDERIIGKRARDRVNTGN
ncbi:MAG: hypothetical protein NTW19_01735, partial [Planctomycetota bacterium]|nr:hypothetical protein [Planctomycetota bacterium]